MNALKQIKKSELYKCALSTKIIIFFLQIEHPQNIEYPTKNEHFDTVLAQKHSYDKKKRADHLIDSFF